MPKIAEIEDTPNQNAVKFMLKEPLTWGISHSYDNAEEAKSDTLASALFNIEHVTNVFYVDSCLTITQDGEAHWPQLARLIAVPLREAPAADASSEALVAAAAVAIAGLSVHLQGACGSCPSSTSSTLISMTSLLRTIEPDIEVLSV